MFLYKIFQHQSCLFVKVSQFFNYSNFADMNLKYYGKYFTVLVLFIILLILRKSIVSNIIMMLKNPDMLINIEEPGIGATTLSQPTVENG